MSADLEDTLSLCSLPPEIIDIVVSQITPKDLLQLALVSLPSPSNSPKTCKHMYKLLRSDLKSLNRRQWLFNRFGQDYHFAPKYLRRFKRNADQYTIPAKSFGIIWMNNSQYWQMKRSTAPCTFTSTMAHLNHVCWVEVNALHTLPPGVYRGSLFTKFGKNMKLDSFSSAKWTVKSGETVLWTRLFEEMEVKPTKNQWQAVEFGPFEVKDSPQAIDFQIYANIPYWLSDWSLAYLQYVPMKHWQ